MDNKMYDGKRLLTYVSLWVAISRFPTSDWQQKPTVPRRSECFQSSGQHPRHLKTVYVLKRLWMRYIFCKKYKYACIHVT